MQELLDEYTKFKGTLYNVEGGPKGTGVTYKDVAGVDHAMDLIQESVQMLLGGDDYRIMGVHPPRVSALLQFLHYEYASQRP